MFMGKILVGYIVDEHIGKKLERNIKHNLKLYGFKIFDTELMDEIVVKYADIGNMNILGLNTDVISGYLHTEIVVKYDVNMYMHINCFSGRGVKYGYSALILPIFDSDMVPIDNYDANYIFYSEQLGKGLIKHCLVYDTVNKLIDLEFSGFSMIFSDFRYVNCNLSYYNYIGGSIDLNWFSDYDITDLDGVYKYNNMCIAYKKSKTALLPRGCKILCPNSFISVGFGREEYDFTNLVLNPELEFICTKNNSRVHSLCVSKEHYSNIKIVDLDCNEIEEYKDVRDLENRLKTIGFELIFY